VEGGFLLRDGSLFGKYTHECAVKHLCACLLGFGAELLLRDDPLFLHFMALALLVSEAENLEGALQHAPEEAADRLCRLRLADEAQARRPLASVWSCSRRV
jgi:hypothetical protein